MTLTGTIITMSQWASMLLKSNSTKSWNYNYNCCLEVRLCVATQVIELYLIINTTLKERQMGLGGREFLTTLWEVRELELQMKDSAAWSWLTYWESINVIGLGITRHNDVKGEFKLSTMGKCLSHRNFAWQKCTSRLHGSYNFSNLPFMVVHINLNLYYL